MRSRFKLARMDTVISSVTSIMAALPVILLVGSFFGVRILLIPAGLLVLIYGWIWLRFRPNLFEIGGQHLIVRWPLRSRRLAFSEISDVSVIDRKELYEKVGFCVRVGAGGLWGGFGWLWTRKRGIVQMYISRTDEFVWFETASGRPWLITPDHPKEFAAALCR